MLLSPVSILSSSPFAFSSGADSVSPRSVNLHLGNMVHPQKLYSLPVVFDLPSFNAISNPHCLQVLDIVRMGDRFLLRLKEKETSHTIFPHIPPLFRIANLPVPGYLCLIPVPLIRN